MDLRDEFAMADEAFALSPISARAALPSEADYDAIREAFMETSRGRWFLVEYAKRNRNADTTMVLDAVARIEQTLAARKQTAPDDGLAKALAAIRSSLDEARTAVAEAFDKPTRDDALAPIQKGVRIIREISWRWREIGGDSRICDLLDLQAERDRGSSYEACRQRRHRSGARSVRVDRDDARRNDRIHRPRRLPRPVTKRLLRRQRRRSLRLA